MKLTKSESRRVWAIDDERQSDGLLIINLAAGYRFSDDIVHARGYVTIAEAREDIRDAIPCECDQCKREIAAGKCRAIYYNPIKLYKRIDNIS